MALSEKTWRAMVDNGFSPILQPDEVEATDIMRHLKNGCISFTPGRCTLSYLDEFGDVVLITVKAWDNIAEAAAKLWLKAHR